MGYAGLPAFRRFVLERVEDATGVSGVGIVAAGVELPSGRCVTQWRATDEVGHGSVVVYDNLLQVVAIHGHQGRTRVVHLDDERPVIAGRHDVVSEMLGILDLERDLH